MPKHPRKTEAGDRKQEQLHREKSLDFEGQKLIRSTLKNIFTFTDICYVLD